MISALFIPTPITCRYAYYQVCVAKSKHTLGIQIVLTTTSNKAHSEADLYISTDNPQPDITHATWISADRGDDSILITTRNPDYIKALARNSGGSTQGQILYVGVLGRTAAVFTIKVIVTPFTYRMHKLHQKKLLRGQKSQLL